MVSPIKILSVTLIVSSLTLSTMFAYGQSRMKLATKKHGLTIGLQSGGDVLYNSSSLYGNKQGKAHYGINNWFVVKKTVSPHFKIESGIKYSQNQALPYSASSPAYKIDNSLKPYGIAIPATLQYYFLPEKSKLRPYCGAGLQYNPFINNTTISPFSGGDVIPPLGTSASQNGTKYINILFTQGVTYEINTKIQVTQSFHFIPDNSNKTFGLDLGIGFTIP